MSKLGLLSCGLILAGSIGVASCGGDDDSSASGWNYTETEQLLAAAEKSILDQTIEYPTDTPAQVSAGVVVIQPGEETGLHRHDAPLVVHVVSGSVTVTYGDGTVNTYEAGSTFVEAIGTEHNGRNDGDEPCVIYTVSIGADGVQNTVKL